MSLYSMHPSKNLMYFTRILHSLCSHLPQEMRGFQPGEFTLDGESGLNMYLRLHAMDMVWIGGKKNTDIWRVVD